MVFIWTDASGSENVCIPHVTTRPSSRSCTRSAPGAASISSRIGGSTVPKENEGSVSRILDPLALDAGVSQLAAPGDEERQPDHGTGIS
jgi:hypothetical protein